MSKETKAINDFPALLAKQCFTKPPSRFTDTSICTKLDQLAILRPSMAGGQITGLLKSRNYIDIKKGSITVTDLGIKVVDFLVESNFNFIDPEFTANLEADLDEISNGNKDKLELLTDFWTSLKEGIEKAKQVKDKKQETDYKCPKCGANLVMKFSSFGAFFSCSNYSNKEKKCEYKANVGEYGEPIEKEKKKLEYAQFKCSKCNSKVVKRISKYGEFWACSSYPKCKAIFDDNGNLIVKKKKKWSKKK